MARPKAGYRAEDGEPVPGTTTIIGRFKDSGALMHWASEQGRLMERGVISSIYERRDSAADAGTLAHELVERYIQGLTPETVLAGVPPEVSDRAQTAYLAYLEWHRQSRIEVIATETVLVSERYRYGGTLDAVFRMPSGETHLGDWKTSNGVYEDYLVQLAAYQQLWNEHYPLTPVTGAHLLRFSKETGDFSHHFYADLSDARELFLLYRRAYSLSQKLRRRIG